MMRSLCLSSSISLAAAALFAVLFVVAGLAAGGATVGLVVVVGDLVLEAGDLVPVSRSRAIVFAWTGLNG